MAFSRNTPTNWKSLTVEALVLHKKDAIKIGPFGSQFKNRELKKQGVRVYGQENILREDFTIGDRFIDELKFKSLRSVELFAGDVVLTMMGSVGAATVVPEGTPTGIMDSHLLRIQPNPALINSEFLAKVLRDSRAIKTQIRARSQGGIMSGLNAKIVRSLEIPIPPLPMQRKIAAILSSVDDTIDKTQAVIDQVQIVKRGLMQKLLTHGVPGRHTRFRQTEIGELPAEWRALPIHTLCSVVRGSTPRPARDPKYFNGDYVPWITVGEVTKDGWPFLLKTRTRLTEEGARFSRYLKSGTVILTNSGVTLGIPKLLKIGGCANDGIAAFQNVSESLGPLFLYYVLSAMTEVFQTRVARGVGQPNLNTSLIGGTLIPVPSRLEQDEISEVLLSCDQQIAAESGCVSELRLLKGALMSVLLSGELRVALDIEAA